ncbi:MAG TPA: hypothetical protein PKG67_12045 [Turneriella sp.]|nr:hypothetical protein [Turneriella sp.]
MKYVLQKTVAIALLTVFSSTAHTEAKSSGIKEATKTPHAKIIVRPGPPVKPTQTAKPVGNMKSDWSGKEKR